MKRVGAHYIRPVSRTGYRPHTPVEALTDALEKVDGIRAGKRRLRRAGARAEDAGNSDASDYSGMMVPSRATTRVIVSPFRPKTVTVFPLSGLPDQNTC